MQSFVPDVFRASLDGSGLFSLQMRGLVLAGAAGTMSRMWLYVA